MRRTWTGIAALILGAVVTAAAVVWLNLRDEAPKRAKALPSSTAEAVERGRYLALAGNCEGCHSLPGEPRYSGGLGVPTPFGVVYAGNLTPDGRHGLGQWDADDFWRAMHKGRSRDGHLLYPAFPYTHFTRISREDADALFAFLRTMPPVERVNPPHDLAFPYNTQAALAVWRALYFKPGVLQPAPDKGSEWNRGAYLVRGLGHCSACHAPRGALGGVDETPELKGGLIPQLNWYAPALGPVAAGASATTTADLRAQWFALLKTGRSAHATASGPMAEVVFKSTQHLRDDDLRAITTFLADLPARAAPATARAERAASASLNSGAALYRDHCATCHGEHGHGTPGAYPRLAGNPSVLQNPPANLVRMLVEGGFMPATAGNPRPHGMPPFGQQLSNGDIAAVLSFIRQSWGHQGSAVAALEVARYR